jgi:hypothetical protein
LTAGADDVHNRTMSSWSRRSWLTLLLALPLAACLETDLTLRADGSVTGTISWLGAADLPEAAARALLAHQGITIKRVDLKDAEIPPAKEGGAPKKARRVTAEIEATDLAALTGAPLLAGLNTSATLGKPDAGKRTLTVRASSSSHVGPPLTTDSVIRLHFPGPVAETSAKASGSEVTWTVPARDFQEKPSVDLSVVYATDGAPPPAP